MRYYLLTSLLLLSMQFNGSFCLAQTTTKLLPEQQYFEKMATYLSKGSGKWTGNNPNYDAANPNSPKAFGLWFERPLPNLLNLTIVAYIQDTVRISSQGIFSWHPAKQQYIHITADRGNGYAEGITAFPNDSTFISSMIIYRPDGRTFDHKDENFIVSENVHRNTSFGKDKAGNWVERGEWVWKRDM